MKFNLKKLSLIVAVLGVMSILGQPAYSQEAKSILWKIQPPENPMPSYLFGTIHMIPSDKFFFTQKMKDAFDSCDKLMLEIDINVSLQDQLALAKDIVLPDGKKIADYLTEEEYKAYRRILIDELGVAKKIVKRAERIYPVFSSGLFLKDILGKTKQYEEYLNKRAKKKSMPVEGLETLAFQMQTVKTISLEDQLKMLKDTASLKQMQAEYYELLDAYVNQDISLMQSMVADDDLSSNIEYNLLEKRNRNWIPIIKRAVIANQCFIAVGAGHLAGEHGIIKLLQDDGWIVTPVN